MITQADLCKALVTTLIEKEIRGREIVFERLGLPSEIQEKIEDRDYGSVLKWIAKIPFHTISNFAREVVRFYNSVGLNERLSNFVSAELYIKPLTRVHIVDSIITFSETSQQPIHGRLSLINFLQRVWNLDELVPVDHRHKNAKADIERHVLSFHDWNYQSLFNEYLALRSGTDRQFACFLEQLVHPEVRKPEQ
jgi:hypothetical protein